MLDSPTDPRRRRFVTAEGLGVTPALLGRPLASPGRRCAALATDLIFVAALINAPTAALAAVVGGAVLWLFLRRRRSSRGCGRAADDGSPWLCCTSSKDHQYSFIGAPCQEQK